MSKSISQQAVIAAECAAIVAEALSLTLADLELVEHAAALQRCGATVELGALVERNASPLRAAVEQLGASEGPDFSSSLRSAAGKIRAARSELIVDAAIAATQSSSVGFQAVHVTHAEDVVTILGSTSRSALMVRIDRESGVIVRDWQIGPGDACVALDAEWSEAMKRRGVNTTTIAQDLHEGRRDGERLITPAAALAPDQPTVGAVLDYRAQGRRTSGRRASPSTPNVVRRVT